MWIILQDFIAITKGLIKKGTDINTVDKKILDINQKINQKKRNGARIKTVPVKWKN